jgi:hypothetical protein
MSELSITRRCHPEPSEGSHESGEEYEKLLRVIDLSSRGPSPSRRLGITPSLALAL